MATLASLPAGAALSARELSEFTGIPRHYLSKIMRRLVLGKLVSSRKGHGGGFALARPAKKIRFAEIFKVADFEFDDGECAYGWGRCDPNNLCPLHPTFRSLRNSVSAWLEGTTLDQVDKLEGVDDVDEA